MWHYNTNSLDQFNLVLGRHPEPLTSYLLLTDSHKHFTPATGRPRQLRASGTAHRRLAHGRQRQVAAFWDCNPFAVRDQGHLQVGLKKMSPGAHWLKIAGLACRQSRVPFGWALQVHTVLALTLTDAFSYCWREKYCSNRIRPERSFAATSTRSGSRCSKRRFFQST